MTEVDHGTTTGKVSPTEPTEDKLGTPKVNVSLTVSRVVVKGGDTNPTQNEDDDYNTDLRL